MERAEDVMLDLAWRRFLDVWEDKRDIDKKASIILASNGVLIGFITNAKDTINQPSTGYAIYGLVFIFISAFLCILTLAPKNYKSFNLERAWGDLEKYMDDLETLKLELYGAISVKADQNAFKIAISATFMAIAISMFLIGLLFISLTVYYSI